MSSANDSSGDDANDGMDESKSKWKQCPYCGQKVPLSQVIPIPTPVVIPMEIAGIYVYPDDPDYGSD